MADAAESARLDELRRRAYGRGAELTADEAAELHDLEQQVRAARAAANTQAVGEFTPAATTDDASVAAADADTPEPDALWVREARAGGQGTEAQDAPRSEDAAADLVTENEPDSEPDAQNPTSPWRRRLIAAAAAIVAVAVGVGVGWALAPRADARPAMTAAQTETWTTMEEGGDYDPGSIELLGEREGASLWSGTRNDGDLDCLILTFGEEESGQCLPPDTDPEQGQLSATLQVERDGRQTEFWGFVMTDLHGNEDGYIQVVDLGYQEEGWGWQFTEDELVIVDQLEAAGFNPMMLSVIGYDGDTPVWLAEEGETCLIVVVDGEIAQACTDEFYGDAVLQLAAEETIYEARNTETRGPQLTVFRVSATSCTTDESTGRETCTLEFPDTGAPAE